MQLAVDHPDRVKAAMAPISRDDARARRRRRTPPARSTWPTPARAAALMQQTVMYSWFGNRLAENARMRLTAEDDLGVLPPRPRRRPLVDASDAVEVEHPDRVAAQRPCSAMLVVEVGESSSRRTPCVYGHVESVCG